MFFLVVHEVALMSPRRRSSSESSRTPLDELFEGYGTHLSVKELQQILGITTSRAYKWLNEGTVPAYRAGGGWVILAGEVKAWMLSQATQPAESRQLHATWGRQGTADALPGQRGVQSLLGLMPVQPGEASLWWVGAHGGAGESSLAVLVKDSKAAAHRWPATPDDAKPANAVLAARTNLTGLQAALRAVTSSFELDRHVLHGVALLADAPGPLPPRLQFLIDELGRHVEVVWTLPWVEQWRTSEPQRGALTDDAWREMLADVDQLLHDHDEERAGVP